MSLGEFRKFDPNSPQKVDPKYAIERFGRPSSGGYSGGDARPTDSKKAGEPTIFGLDDLYGKNSKQFVFEGETYDLLRTGHNGQVTENFLMATHVRPVSVQIAPSDMKYWQ